MKLTIEFEIDEKVDVRTVQYLIMDALGEFVSHRSPATEYVNKRYPDTPDYAWLNREDKVAEVIRRCRIADIMHNGEITVTKEK